MAAYPVKRVAPQHASVRKTRLDVARPRSNRDSLKYCGLLHSEVDDVRSIPDFDGDVIYDPTDDVAHANIIIKDKGPGETVTEALVRHLKFLQPNEVAQQSLFSSCA